MSFAGGGSTGRGEASWTAPKRPPPTVVCYICGRSYGTASITIHSKACAKRFEEEQSQLPKAQRRPLPQPPSTELLAELAAAGGGGGGGLAGAAAYRIIEAHNEAAFRQYNDVTLVACALCGRTFSGPDRLRIHNRSCTPESPARRVGEKGVGNGGAPTAYAVNVDAGGALVRGGALTEAEAEAEADAEAEAEAEAQAAADAEARQQAQRMRQQAGAGSGARAAAAAQRSPPAVRAATATESKRGEAGEGAGAGVGAGPASGAAEAWRASVFERLGLLQERLEAHEQRAAAEAAEIRGEIEELAAELREARLA